MKINHAESIQPCEKCGAVPEYRDTTKVWKFDVYTYYCEAHRTNADTEERFPEKVLKELRAQYARRLVRGEIEE